MKMWRQNTFNKACAQLLFVVCCAGCLSPIDVEVDRLGGMLVVSGQVSNIDDRNVVQVGRTSGAVRLPEAYSGAIVEAIDEFGEVITYNESAVYVGEYVGDKAGVPGRTYTLRVRLLNGEVYESEPEQMPLSSGKLQTRYDFITEKNVDAEGTILDRTSVRVYGNSVLPGRDTAKYFRWSTEELYMIVPTDFPDPFGNVPPNCFVTAAADPQRVTIHNGDEVATTTLNDQLLVSRQIDQSFYARHYFTVYQSAITAEAHDYWRKVNIVANQVGSIFDSPPAEVRGNIHNTTDNQEKVAGFFQATHQVFSRLYILRDELPIKLPVYCDYSPDRRFESYPAECLNCLSPRRSSLDRPPWF
jgi:hypothetical protein